MSWFKVKDLMINVIGSGGGNSGRWEDGEIPRTASPYVVVAANHRTLGRVKRVTERLEKQDRGGAAVREVVDNLALGIGRGIVHAAMEAGEGSGARGADDDDRCPVWWTFPTTQTFIIDLSVLNASHLPQLNAQLREAVAVAEAAEQGLAPDSGKEVMFVQGKLEGALAELGTVAPQAG